MSGLSEGVRTVVVPRPSVWSDTSPIWDTTCPSSPDEPALDVAKSFESPAHVQPAVTLSVLLWAGLVRTEVGNAEVEVRPLARSRVCVALPSQQDVGRLQVSTG